MDQSKEIKGIISRYYSSKTTNSGMRNGAVHGSRTTMHILDKSDMSRSRGKIIMERKGMWITTNEEALVV